MLEYLSRKWLLWLVGVGSSTASIALAFIAVVGALYGFRRLRMGSVAMGALFVALLYVTPMFVIEYLFYDPLQMGQVAESLLLFPNPLYLIPISWALRRVMGVPRPQAVEALGDILNAQYIMLLLFRMFSSVIPHMLPGSVWADYRYLDSLAMVLVLITTAALVAGIHLFRRLRPLRAEAAVYTHTLTPPRALGRAMAGALGNYVLAVLFCTLIFSERRADAGPDQWLIYLILILVFALRMAENLRRRKLHLLERQESISNEYIHALKAAGNALRGIRHDWSNILQVYEGYIATDDLEGLRRYHSSVVRTAGCCQQSFELLASLSRRKAVCTLLELKLQRARQHGVHMDLGPLDDLAAVSMCDLDLCRVLGNLLDNAIEAACETEARWVQVRCTPKNPRTLRVEITNSAKGPDPGPNPAIGYSAKRGHSGMGLCAVRQILASHGGGHLLLRQREGTFYAQLTLGLGPE